MGQRGGTGGDGLPGIPRRIVMSQGAYITVVGFVAQDPRLREIREGVLVTDLRVGSTRRVLDRMTNTWRDAETSYFDISCWRKLGEHVRASLHKGEPVMVKGRLRLREWVDKTGVTRTAIEIMADTVGHDLNRGVANYLRSDRRPVATENDPVMAERRDLAEDRDMSEDRDMIDEDAIEQFDRELERLGEAGVAAQHDDSDDNHRDDDDENEAADVTASTAPSVPF
jgi:single-strand DNA-binding protein